MRKFINIIFLFLLFFIIFPLNVQAKDYYFKEVLTNIYINQDGSFDVEIERTYHFSGSFSWATYYIDKKGFNEIEDFILKDDFGEFKRTDYETQEERTYTFQNLGNMYSIKFFYKAENEDKTFYFKYKVLGGINSYLDIADFYWKVIEDRWEEDTKYFECKIYFPEEINEDSFYVFAHGPLWGEIEKNNGKGAILTIKDLPKNTFVEARILFPSYILNVQKIGEYKLDEILSYERELANESNLERNKAKLIIYILILIPLIILAICFFLFRKYGIEFKPSKDYLYIREPPDNLPPSIVGYLFKWKQVDAKDFTATLMDLIRKGYIKIETKEKEVGLLFKRTKNILFFTKTNKSSNDLKIYEKIIYDFLFSSLTYSDVINFYSNKSSLKIIESLFKGKSGLLPDIAGKNETTVSTEDINNFIKKHPQEFRTIFNAFSENIKEEGGELGYFEETGFKIGIILAIFSIIFLVLTIYFAIMYNVTFLIIYSIIISGLTILLSIFMPRRSKVGSETFNKWNGLKRFLTDFSNLREAIPKSIIIWDKYLVYAVTFGIAEKVIDELKILLPNINENEISKSYLIGAFYSSGSFNFDSFSMNLTSMISSFNSITQIASSSLSSSGGGGGFSGGGG
ncbi:MAG TPA: DUF2207 domain-containing protein, partial [Caldisericia bacterium]|nr:DUF2207 domain-containing protein [Caldisericia bacterium]